MHRWRNVAGRFAACNIASMSALFLMEGLRDLARIRVSIDVIEEAIRQAPETADIVHLRGRLIHLRILEARLIFEMPKEMWIVTFDDGSIVRVWTREDLITQEAVGLAKCRENYYDRKYSIVSVKRE